MWLPLLLLAAFLPAAAPARALPPGPPVVEGRSWPTPDPLVFELEGGAVDPDGPIQSITICVLDGSKRCETVGYVHPQTLQQQLAQCLYGDGRSFAIQHTFPGAGEYEVSVSATAGGCPVVGEPETSTTTFTVVAHEPQPIPCASEGEPHATDVGVDEEFVRIASTVSYGGSFATPDVLTGMIAAVEDANAAGGICGRMVQLTTVDDGGDPVKGRQYIENFAAEQFALAVMPSADTLEAAIRAGDFARLGIPVGGTPGARPAEFTDPLVWSMGASPRSFASVVAGHAYDEGARRFGIVWDRSTSQGTASARALRAAIGALPGAALVADEGILSGRASYSAEIQRFNNACAGSCDAVVLVLDEPTALTWMAGRPQTGTMETSAATSLFRESFGRNCGASCAGWLAWTDLHPPVGSYGSEIANYVTSVRRRQPTIDVTNRDLQAAWFGMRMLLEQMGAVGVDLTRAALRARLDDGIDLGVTGGPLVYGARRDGNHWLRAYRLVVAQGSFAGWRDETGWIAAP